MNEEEIVTEEEILKRIENIFQVEMDLAKQVSEVDTYQTIGFLKREVLAVVGAQRAQLKKLHDHYEKRKKFLERLNKKKLHDGLTNMRIQNIKIYSDFLERLELLK